MVTSYRKILGLFADSYGEDVARMTILIGQNDLVAAEKIAHALKGLAGNIGAPPIQALATNLDTALKHGDEAGAEAALATLTESLSRLIDVLRVVLADPGQTPMG